MLDNLTNKIEEFKIPIALSVVGVVLIIGGVLSSGLDKQKPKEYPKESLVQAQKSISVDVSGAVNNPGVYKLNDGDRIEEAIKAGGGFSEKANQEYISKYLNMAQKLSDGTKVYVPYEGEVSANTGGLTGVAGAVSVQGKVNINTSSQSEIESLPGIGPVTASKIIAARRYASIDELLSKKVVSKSVYEKIKDSVVTY